ncbi:MAG: hypothetical protein Q9209_005919 [Squamulea sp. 1 TL-2023]
MSPSMPHLLLLFTLFVLRSDLTTALPQRGNFPATYLGPTPVSWNGPTEYLRNHPVHGDDDIVVGWIRPELPPATKIEKRDLASSPGLCSGSEKDCFKIARVKNGKVVGWREVQGLEVETLVAHSKEGREIRMQKRRERKPE